MSNVFISYRRLDSKTITGRIYDRLVAEFGADHVFKDVYSIPAGRDFRGVLQEAVAKCDVQLVVIGSRWLAITDENGKRRLDDPDDFVRIEVQSALQRDGCLVIPVLVNGAEMPRAEDLPDGLSQLAYRNAKAVRDDPDFQRDMDDLISELRAHAKVLNTGKKSSTDGMDSNTRAAVIAGIFAVIAAIIAGILGLWQGVFSNADDNGITLEPTPTITVAQVAAASPTLEPASTATDVPTLTTVLPTATDSLTLTATRTPPVTATIMPSVTPTPEPTATPRMVATESPPSGNSMPVVETRDFNGHAYARVPAGAFQGEDVPEFWIMTYEVSNAEFATFLQSRGSLISREGESRYATASTGSRIELVRNQWQVVAGYENHPATRVTWYGARDYCEWVDADARLPTGTEWHKAAAWNPETNNASTYPWGEQAPDDTLAQFSSTDTAPVDAHPAGRSPLGVYNMAGNVIEWSADTRGINRFLRGGGYEDVASALRASSSTQVTHTHSSPATGFRCVIDS